MIKPLPPLPFTGRGLPTVFNQEIDYFTILSRMTEKIDEITKAINTKLTDIVKERINDIMLDVTYDEDTETITFKANLRGGDTHEYDPVSKTMIIK